MKITEKHLELNPALSDFYKVGDNVETDTVIDPLDKACDNTNPNDPHYNQAGSYDKKCNWIPDIG